MAEMKETVSGEFIPRVRAALTDLQQKPHSLNQIWGAAAHRFVPNPPISRERVSELELGHGIELPADYRAYLTELGNGGAGPWQGLLPLEEAIRESVVGCPDCLSQPFRHGQAFVDRDGRHHRWFQFRDPRARGYVVVPPEEAVSPGFMRGSLVIAYGKPTARGATAYRLVLGGPEAGRIWRDDRARSGSVGPCEGGLHGLAEADFRDWFLTWLDDSRLAHQFSL
jgi:hypothetical protein